MSNVTDLDYRKLGGTPLNGTADQELKAAITQCRKILERHPERRMRTLQECLATYSDVLKEPYSSADEGELCHNLNDLYWAIADGISHHNAFADDRQEVKALLAHIKGYLINRYGFCDRKGKMIVISL